MFNNFSNEAKEVILIAGLEMKELKHPYIGSEHLLLSILKHNNIISRKLKNYNLTYNKFKEEIIKTIGKGTKESKYLLYTPLLKRILNNVSDYKEVTVKDLFNSLLSEGDGIAIRLLISMNIDIDKLINIKEKPKKELRIINKYGINLNEKALNNEIDPVIGREKETERLIEILSRRCKNNPILVGKAGVGKTAIVENLSRKIINGEVPLFLRNKKIISIDLSSLVAGTKYRGEFEEKINRLIKEVELNDDIILFIDEVHCIVGAGGAEGAIDASNILKPALARGKIRLIGATTTDEYKKYIEKDEALKRRFQNIEILEPTKNMTKKILYKLKPLYEKYHNVIIDNKIIDYIVNQSDKYIKDRCEPDKSIDILDEVCAKTSLKGSKELKEYDLLKKEYDQLNKYKYININKGKYKNSFKLKDKENIILDKMNKLEIRLMKTKKRKVIINDVNNLISYKTKIPLNKIDINKINDKMKSIIKGQDNIIAKLSKEIKKIKLGYNKTNTYMFIGDKHVGKNTLAKIFGEYLVGSDNIIKSDDMDYIIEKVKEKPYSVVIINDIKDNYEILNDIIKNKEYKCVDFKNTIIIMICNNIEKVGFINNNINLCDNVLYFNKLNNNIINEILNNKINKIKNKYKNIKININLKKIDNITYIDNYIKEIENKIIDGIVEDKNFVNI